MIHEYATLPGHDPSKVRGVDCITASKSEALDVRVLQVAEWLAMRERWAASEEAAKCYAAHAETLRNRHLDRRHRDRTTRRVVWIVIAPAGDGAGGAHPVA